MSEKSRDAEGRLQRQVDVLQGVVALLLHLQADDPRVARYEGALADELARLDPSKPRHANRIERIEAYLAAISERHAEPFAPLENRW